MDNIKEGVMPMPVNAAPEAAPLPKKRSMSLRRMLRGLNPPGKIWYYSCRAYQLKLHPIAWALKAFNYFFFRAILCYECRISNDIHLDHFALGVCVHPNVVIGRNVRIYHHVSIAAETAANSDSPIVIEDDVVIGAHAILVGNDNGGIRIGKGAIIGPGAIVNRSVEPGTTIVAMPARPVKIDPVPSA